MLPGRGAGSASALGDATCGDGFQRYVVQLAQGPTERLGLDGSQRRTAQRHAVQPLHHHDWRTVLCLAAERPWRDPGRVVREQGQGGQFALGLAIGPAAEVLPDLGFAEHHLVRVRLGQNANPMHGPHE